MAFRASDDDGHDEFSRSLGHKRRAEYAVRHFHSHHTFIAAADFTTFFEGIPLALADANGIMEVGDRAAIPEVNCARS